MYRSLKEFLALLELCIDFYFELYKENLTENEKLIWNPEIKSVINKAKTNGIVTPQEQHLLNKTKEKLEI